MYRQGCAYTTVIVQWLLFCCVLLGTNRKVAFAAYPSGWTILRNKYVFDPNYYCDGSSTAAWTVTSGDPMPSCEQYCRGRSGFACFTMNSLAYSSTTKRCHCFKAGAAVWWPGNSNTDWDSACITSVVATPAPTPNPTRAPTRAPTRVPTKAPTRVPTRVPTRAPTRVPTATPTSAPTPDPTPVPTGTPTDQPTPGPTLTPTLSPSLSPTQVPTSSPSAAPTPSPTPVSWSIACINGAVLWPAFDRSLEAYIALSPVGTAACGEIRQAGESVSNFQVASSGQTMVFDFFGHRVNITTRQVGGSCVVSSQSEVACTCTAEYWGPLCQWPVPVPVVSSSTWGWASNLTVNLTLPSNIYSTLSLNVGPAANKAWFPTSQQWASVDTGASATWLGWQAEPLQKQTMRFLPHHNGFGADYLAWLQCEGPTDDGVLTAAMNTSQWSSSVTYQWSLPVSVSYPAPTITPVSLRLHEGTAPGAAYVLGLSSQDLLDFEGTGFLATQSSGAQTSFGAAPTLVTTDTSLQLASAVIRPNFAITYGPADNLTMFSCTLWSSTQTRVTCLTQELPGGLSSPGVMRFQVTLGTGTHTRTATGTDLFAYPTRPMVLSVSGCVDVDGSAVNTTECPTDAAGVTLQITGRDLLPGTTIFIGARECKGAADRTDFTRFVCALPIGSGTQQVVALLGTQRSVDSVYVTYRLPSVTALSTLGGECQQDVNDTRRLKNCPRTGNFPLVIQGSDLLDTNVLIGFRQCTPVAGQDLHPQHTQIICTAPPGSLPDQPVLVVLCGTERENEATLSYSACPDGYYQAEGAANSSFGCHACAPGRARLQTDETRTVCTDCPKGSAQAAPASGTCELCPTGTYQPATRQASCLNCSFPLYQDTVGATACKRCADSQYPILEGGQFKECSVCPDGVQCPKGLVLPKSDYFVWITSSGVMRSVRCPKGQCLPNACDPSKELCSAFGRCETGRINPMADNPLCSRCVEGLQQWGSECLECPGTRYGVFVLMFLGTLVFVAVYVRIAQKGSGTLAIYTYYVQTAYLVMHIVARQQFADPLSLFNANLAQTTTGTCLMVLAPAQHLMMGYAFPCLVFVQLGMLALVHYTLDRYRHKLPVAWRRKFDNTVAVQVQVHRRSTHVPNAGATASAGHPEEVQGEVAAEGPTTNERSMPQSSSTSVGLTAPTSYRMSMSQAYDTRNYLLSSTTVLRPWSFHMSIYGRGGLALFAFCYNRLVETTFEFFDCVEVNNGQRVVKVNAAVDCNGEAYTRLLPLVIIIFIAVCLVAPLLLCWRIFHAQRNGDFQKRGFHRYFGLWTEVFRLRVVYWGLYLLVRRSVLLALLVFLSERPYIREVSVTLLLQGMTILHMFTSPYTDESANLAETFSLIGLSVLSYLSSSLSGEGTGEILLVLFLLSFIPLSAWAIIPRLVKWLKRLGVFGQPLAHEQSTGGLFRASKMKQSSRSSMSIIGIQSVINRQSRDHQKEEVVEDNTITQQENDVKPDQDENSTVRSHSVDEDPLDVDLDARAMRHSVARRASVVIDPSINTQWQVFITDDEAAIPYYFNSVTGESVWERPVELDTVQVAHPVPMDEHELHGEETPVVMSTEYLSEEGPIGLLQQSSSLEQQPVDAADAADAAATATAAVLQSQSVDLET